MIDTKSIRNKVLHLAITGRLVDQRPEEGTAEELYCQIQEEKERLVKEGKIKKEKPLPEITEEEEPFEIPETWKWVRLGDLLQVISGISYDKKDISSSGYRILRGGNIQQTKILLEKDDVFLPEQYRDSKKEIRQGDILIVASTGSKIVIGKPGFVDRPIPNTMIGAFLRICRSYTVYTQDWLKCLFSSEFYREHIRDLAGGTNINNIRESYITEFVVPLPPLKEQKRISDKINGIFSLLDAIDLLQMQCGINANILKGKLLAAALTGRLVEQRPEEGTAEELYCQIQEEKERLVKEGKIKKEKPLPEITEEEEPFEIPETWKWVRLSSVGITKTGNTPSKLHTDYFGSFIPFIGPGDIQNNVIKYNHQGLSESGANFGRTVEAGSVLQVCIGSIGKCAISKMRVSFNQQINAITPLVISEKYLFYILNSQYFLTSIKMHSRGTVTPIINRGTWDAIPIPLPPLEEQKRIVNKLDELLALCRQLEGRP